MELTPGEINELFRNIENMSRNLTELMRAILVLRKILAGARMNLGRERDGDDYNINKSQLLHSYSRSLQNERD